VGKTKRKQEAIYVDHVKFALLVRLSTQSRIPRSVLWREALDDLIDEVRDLEKGVSKYLNPSGTRRCLPTAGRLTTTATEEQ
jgi:Ribbon-helix-helix domain